MFVESFLAALVPLPQCKFLLLPRVSPLWSKLRIEKDVYNYVNSGKCVPQFRGKHNLTASNLNDIFFHSQLGNDDTLRITQVFLEERHNLKKLWKMGIPADGANVYVLALHSSTLVQTHSGCLNHSSLQNK